MWAHGTSQYLLISILPVCLARKPSERLRRPDSEFDAPEVRLGGLASASQRSDVFSLCSVLLTLFSNVVDSRADAACSALKLGCDELADGRASLKDIETALRGCLEASPEPKPPFAPPSEGEIPASEYWSEGQLLPFRDMTLRIVSRLGSGGVGRTFKVEQIDPAHRRKFWNFRRKGNEIAGLWPSCFTSLSARPESYHFAWSVRRLRNCGRMAARPDRRLAEMDRGRFGGRPRRRSIYRRRRRWRRLRRTTAAPLLHGNVSVARRHCTPKV